MSEALSRTELAGKAGKQAVFKVRAKDNHAQDYAHILWTSRESDALLQAE